MLQRETKRKQGSARDLLPISDFMLLFYRLADQHIAVDKTAPFSYKAFRSCSAKRAIFDCVHCVVRQTKSPQYRHNDDTNDQCVSNLLAYL